MSFSVSSAAGKSVLTDCSSTSSYKDLHHGYTRRLLNGRHPRSFPKQSELWVHYRASNKRLERITKGHRLWHIVDKQDNDGESWDEDWAAGEDKGAHHETKETHQAPSGGLKDLGVDLDASTRLHYGMVIVVVNSNEELVCVNEYNETMVKKLDQMTPKDHFLFKLVDLGDPTYPGPLVYSRPVWLQIFKRGAVDNSMQFGQLIGGKLFAPPSMSSAQLEQQARMAALKEEEQDRMSRSVVGGGAGRRRSSSSAATGAEYTEPIEKGRRTRHKDSNVSKTVQAVDQPDVCGGISVINIMGGKSHGADKTDEAGSRHRTRSSWHLGQWIVRNAVRKEETESKNKREQVASDDDIYLEQDLYCLASSAGSRFAPWPKRAHSPHSERYRKKAQRMNPAKLEKEAHTANEGPTPTTDLMLNIQDGVGKGDDQIFPELNSMHSESYGNRPGTPDSDMTSLSSLMSVVGGVKEKEKIGISSAEDVYGCLRKVVLRGPPYVLIVDRKCVWKLCPANNFGDTNELSAKEKIAHKLLRSAEEGLEQSKKGREGGRVHDNISFEGHPLLGGEKFPKQLRTILSHHAFNKETKQLNLRRKQEKLIESHFHGMYEEGRGWPDGKPFPSPLPKPSRCSPPSSPSNSFYVTSGGPTEPVPEKLVACSTSKQLTSKASSSGLKEDNTYGADMLRLHRSLHAANVKLIGTMASNNPPTTPFSATFGYAGDISTASIAPSSSSSGTRGSILLNRRHESGDSLSAEGHVSSGYGQIRDKDKSGVHNVETALAMGRLTKRLDKLAAVDEVVNQALRHRERIAKYGRIAAVFKNLSSTDGLSKPQSATGEKLFIPDINIDGYDPSCGT